jgi:hypothetical protein
MRKLHARGRRQHELQSIVAEDSAGGDGDESAPTMSATKHRVAGGAGHFRVGLPGKDLREEILDRAPHFSLGGIEVLTGYRCLWQYGAPHDPPLSRLAGAYRKHNNHERRFFSGG